VKRITRRRFLARTAAPAIATAVTPTILSAAWSGLAEASAAGWFAEEHRPHIVFPTAPRERIAIASYPFREFILGRHDSKETGSGAKLALKDFAAHVRERFNIRRIEPWSEHFLSLEPVYLGEIRAGVEKAQGAIVNIAVDGEHSPYAQDKAERARAIAFSRDWIDAAVRIGSPSVRTNIPQAADAKPDVQRTSESLRRVAEYGARKNIAVHLENDNPVSENPFFLVEVINRVSSPWLRALPDFGNSVAALPEEEAYRGIDAMFARAYEISHVKDTTTDRDGKVIRVDVARTFAIAARHGYKGFFSMEWEGQGDPYAGTAKLVEMTLQNLA
jgi:sugar phosphate isomerase/epimerase